MQSLILTTTTRLLAALLLMFSVYALLRGHNLPGGGFIGGLIGATAFILYTIATSVEEAQAALRIDPSNLAMAGLGVAALGGIGAATNLFPALTLGCGAVGGSSSSNNVSPLDLINIRRVAWGIEEERSGAPVSEVDAALVEQLAKKILERLG